MWYRWYCTFRFTWLVSSSLLVLDGVGEHRGDAGHVLRDRHHLPVPSHGHGRRVGVLQLPQLQRDRGWEEHVLRWPDASVPPTRWDHDCVFCCCRCECRSVIAVKQLQYLYCEVHLLPVTLENWWASKMPWQYSLHTLIIPLIPPQNPLFDRQS